MENLTEPQVWAMFGTMSIAFALRSIGALLGLWLALRIAANIRASEEDNMLAKVLGSIFGVLMVMGAAYWQVAYIAYRADVANGLKAMDATLSAGGQRFADRFASADPVTTPGALLIVFDLTVLLMILGSIWMKKKA